MIKPLLLCGCCLTLAWPVFAEKPSTEVLKSDAPAPTMDPGDLLRKIQALDAADDSSRAADITMQQKQTGSSKSAGGGMQGPTVITARDTDFQEKQHIAVFTNKVVVNNASFSLLCDKMTAYLAHKSPTEKAAPKPATPPPAAKGKVGAMAGPDNDALEKAVAEGAVQVSQDKMDDSGNITHSVGHGKKAVYEKSTGTIALMGMPDVQQGDNLCVATAESTIIYMYRDGRMWADGPHKITIKEGQQQKQPGQ